MGRRHRGTLTTRKLKRGKVWIARVYIAGKRQSRTIGLVRDIPKREAQRLLDAMIPTEVQADATLAEFLDEYEPIFHSNAPASFELAYQQLRACAQRLDKPMRDVTEHDAALLIAGLRQKGLRGPDKKERALHGNTVRAIAGRLRAIWKAAAKRKLVQDNPFVGLKLPKKTEAPVNALTAEQVDRLLPALSGTLRHFVHVLAETGLRRGEGLRLDWADVRDGLLTVRESKNGHPRAFKLSRRALLAFDSIPGKRKGAIFPGYIPDKKVAAAELRKLASACKRAEVPVIHFRALRHTLGFRMASAGATELEVAAVLGHRNLSTTKRYMDHHPGSGAARAAGKLDEAEHQPNFRTGLGDSGSRRANAE